jgi:hypothetical protein
MLLYFDCLSDTVRNSVNVANTQSNVPPRSAASIQGTGVIK